MCGRYLAVVVQRQHLRASNPQASGFFWPQAGHKALHTCASWYAYAAMFGSSNANGQSHTCGMLQTTCAFCYSTSWTCFVNRQSVCMVLFLFWGGGTVPTSRQLLEIKVLPVSSPPMTRREDQLARMPNYAVTTPVSPVSSAGSTKGFLEEEQVLERTVPSKTKGPVMRVPGVRGTAPKTHPPWG